MGSDFSKDGCFHFPTMDERNLDTLRDYVRNYNPPEGCGGCINILLFGMVGAGKSSTINTFLSALDPRGATITCVPTGNNPGSLTPELRSYRAEKIKFWDTAGWNVMETTDLKKRVLQMILEGRVPKETDFENLAVRTGMERRSMFVVSNQWKGERIEMIKCILALYVLDNMVRHIDRFLKAV